MVHATTKIIDSTIINLDVRNKFKINVVAIRRGEEILIPTAATVVEQDDQLLLIGKNSDLDKFNQWLRK